MTELVESTERFGRAAAAVVEPGPEGADVLSVAGQGLTAKPLSPGRLAWIRFRRHKLAMLSAVVLILLTIVVFFPQILTPWGPLERDLDAAQFEGPSAEHWFGTDALRQDMLARVLYGGQVSLQVGFAVALISTAIGAAIGAGAGFFGGKLDDFLMRVTDLFLGVPQLVALIILTTLPARNAWAETFLGEDGSVRSIITVMALLFWMPIARVVRGLVLSLKEKEFVEAAKAMGASDWRIVSRHLLPNCIGPLIVAITLAVAAAILTESALSFLGFGVESVTTPTWGNLLSNTKGQLRNHGHVVWFPGLAIVVTVLCVNYLGDGLRDALDPRQAKK
jgi:peptide/nickel transport system permease protein